MPKLKRTQKTSHKRLIMVVAGVIALGAVLLLAVLINPSKKNLGLITPQASSSPSSSQPAKQGTANGQIGNAPASISTSPKTPTPTPAITPAGPVPNPPTGNPLNVHEVSLSSSSTAIVSTCQTAAKIICAVQARNTNTGMIITAKTVTTDENGVAIINWDSKVLETGTWDIRLAATTSGGTAISTIFDQLRVNP